MKNKIEFIKGEKFARYNGELTTREWFYEKMGIPCEFDWFLDDLVIINGEIFSDLTIGEILFRLGDHFENSIYCKSVKNLNDDEINKFLSNRSAYNTKFITGLKSLMPLYMFNINYPDFNKEFYSQFMDDFDNYYNTNENNN